MAERAVTNHPNAPDFESSTHDYAKRFSGPVGEWFLKNQREATQNLLEGSSLSVLDVGGGHGQNIDAVLELGHKLTILGSPGSSTEMIQPEIDAGKITFISGSFLDLPCKNNSFDVVISYRTVSHMDQLDNFLGELTRVANSTVIVDYPSSRSFNIMYSPLFFLKEMLENNTREFNCFSANQIFRLFEKHEFINDSQYKQFFLPMVFHRLTRLLSISRMSEKLFRILGLTRLFGSPVISRFQNHT